MSFMAGRHGGRKRQPRNHIFNSKDKVQRSNRKWEKIINSQGQHSVIYFLQEGYTSLYPLQVASQSGDHGLKYLKLWGTFLTQSSTIYSEILSEINIYANFEIFPIQQ